MSRKLFIKTMGCQMNEYDSDKMADVLHESHGFELTSAPENADLLLINSCSIREKSQEKVFSQLGRWRAWKEKQPEIMIGVGGCVASQEGEGIRRRAPYVDIVFGPQTLHRLPAMVDSVQKSGVATVDVSFPEIEKFDCLPEPHADGPTAFVSVMEGCSKYCSYCVVPYTRGEEISRPLDDVIAEVVGLASKGVLEINLLGQNVNAYRGPMNGGSIADLATLIYYVAAIEGVNRIRFTTSHPVEFTDSLIDAYAEIPKLANYLHLPVQHGSDRILSAMKRGHTVLEYKSKIRKLRAVRPDISVSSDFIVGFPGETESQFQASLDMLHDIRFDKVHVAAYSPRSGTIAHRKMTDDVPPDEKIKRLRAVEELQEQISSEINSAYLHTTQEVLIDGHNKGKWQGRTRTDKLVFVESDENLLGTLINVQIIRTSAWSLQGAVEASSPGSISLLASISSD